MRAAALAPGLYYEPVQPVRATGVLARGDVPLFVGLTRRGPPMRAIRVESMREVAALFGDPPATGALMPALRGFFETGGAAAYVMRIVDGGARPATATLGGGWHAEASFGWAAIDPRRVAGETSSGSEAWATLVEAYLLDGARVADPGQWGNRLQVAIARSSRAQATLDALPGNTGEAIASSLGGLYAGTIVELFQDGLAAVTRITAIDAARRILRLATPPGALGLDPGRPFRLASVDFRIDVLLDGKLAERFEAVSPAPDHARSVARMLGDSRYVALTAPDGADLTDRAGWPAETLTALSGGRDGVTVVGVGDYTAAFEAAQRVEEAALIAAPDLVAAAPAPVLAPPPQADAATDCCDLAPPPLGRLTGQVRDGDSDMPVVGVSIEPAGHGARAVTDTDGRFALAPVPAALLTVRLDKPGYESAEILLQAEENTPADPPVIMLMPLGNPNRLGDTDILMVQRMMAYAAGPYRVAIVDPPRPDMKPDALLTWRAQLGDSDRLAFFAPWIVAPDGTPVPPSGHVCGALAAGERASGIARAPANLPLRHCIAPTLAIDDAVQAVLHAAGVNAIRAFPGRGVRVWGARTLSSDPEWQHLPARRVVDAIERTLEATLQWAVFEPNTVVTRQAVAFTIETLLDRLWRAGGLAGESPAAAFRVKCDEDNNPADARDRGELIAEVAVAPAIPFEFVVFRIAKSLDSLSVGD